MADSGAEWGRKVVLAWTSWEPGLDTGSAAETWMDIVLFDLPKLGITMVGRSAQCQLKTVRTGAADGREQA